MRQIVNYLKKNSGKGYSMESLKWALVNQGYSKGEVDKAILVANKELADQAPKFVEKPVIKVDVQPEPEITFWGRIKGWFS